jgi:hypothetical protein
LQEDHDGGFPGREKSKRWQFRFNPPNLKCARCFGNLLTACGRGALDDSQWISKKPFHCFSEFNPSLNLEETKFLVTDRFVYNERATPNSNFHVIPNA